MTLKWKWLAGCFIAVVLMIMALPVVTQAAGIVISGTVPLAVSGVDVSGITGSGATITWTTNSNATSQVFYDTITHNSATDYAHSTTLDNTLISNHSQNLSGLVEGTTYYFRVKSTATIGGNNFVPVSAEYTFNTKSSGGGGGGGSGGGGGGPSGPTTVAGVTNITSIVNAKGIFSQSVYVWSDDNKILLAVGEGTTGTTSSGTPLTQISIIHQTTPPPLPEGANIIGLAYDFEPSGVTFNPPITIRFNYDPALLPAGVIESNLQIAYFDSTLNAWVTLITTSVDTVNHYIFAQISHFTPYAVTYGVKPATPALTTTTPIVVTTTTPTTTTPTSTPTTTATTPVTTITTQSVTTTTPVVTPLPTAFESSSLIITPSTVKPNQSIKISFKITNTSDVTGTYTTVLKINNVVVDSKNVTLTGGHSTVVTFTTSSKLEGNYDVDVAGLSGNFSVSKNLILPWFWPGVAGGIILGVILGVLVGLLKFRKL